MKSWQVIHFNGPLITLWRLACLSFCCLQAGSSGKVLQYGQERMPIALSLREPNAAFDICEVVIH